MMIADAPGCRRIHRTASLVRGMLGSRNPTRCFLHVRPVQKIQRRAGQDGRGHRGEDARALRRAEDRRRLARELEEALYTADFGVETTTGDPRRDQGGLPRGQGAAGPAGRRHRRRRAAARARRQRRHAGRGPPVNGDPKAHRHRHDRRQRLGQDHHLGQAGVDAQAGRARPSPSRPATPSARPRSSS
jgi:hypothetical protein